MQEWINTTAEEVGGGVCILSMQEETEAKAKGKGAMVSRVKTR